MNQLQMVECHWKVVSRRKIAHVIESLVSARSLQLESVRTLHKALLILVVMYDSETDMKGEGEI